MAAAASSLRRERRRTPLLKLSCCLSLRQVLQAQAHLTSSGLLTDPFVASRLLDASLRLSPLSHSLLLFRRLPNAGLFHLNSLILRLQSPLPFFFSALATHPLTPNSFTFTSLLSSSSSDLTSGEIIHAQAVKRFQPTSTPHVPNALIHMYATCGLISSARQMFDEMPIRDLVSWNSMVDGYAKVGDLEEAMELFDRMPERNVVSWNVVISGCLRWRRTEMALGLVRRVMTGEGRVRGDVRTMVCAATGCGRMGRAWEGRSVHGYFLKNFVREEGDNVIFGTALVDMYGKCGKVGDATKVFDGLRERNLVCWNAMIVGCCVHGDLKKGIALFEEMVKKGKGTDNSLQPDEVTFSGVLLACARGCLLEEGKKYFEQMTSLYNLKPTFAHYWCMANLYGSLGLIQEAEEVLKGMPEENESLVWSNLLGYCRFRGDIELGERIGKALIELEPFNGSRYTLLWNVYMAAGQWQDAQNVKETMKERGVRQMPNGRLPDLNELVHNFKVGDRFQSEIENIYTMMDDFAVTLKLPGVAVNLTERSMQ